ncbi:MAG: UDP-N-acetylmuramoyl-tripeptide--D-alanyl-D-alanine ligase [Anaerolineae bacterium]|nr:UDP-N-acetylmuramoyl-tripeptide--D-alanyl-D-alanine ligase [Anaerolineae bacterium]
MHTLALILIFLWILPVLIRTYQMARYYQIEEYQSMRFLRWLREKRSRWFPQYMAVPMLIGVVGSAILQLVKIKEPAVHFILWLGVAAFLSRPEPVKETKKQFNRTPRATRLLAAAFITATLFVVSAVLFTTRNMDADTPQELSTVAIVGFIGVLFSPLALIAGNQIMYPVEEAMRRRFREQARRKLQESGADVIGITGSFGKTTTKHMLAHLLGGHYKVLPTPKSYNTLMGVSLAINNDLDPRAGYDYFIAEMGAYIPGEIAEICQLTRPKISIVTAVGPQHLERFKTIENVVKAKYEIVEGLPPDGCAIFNGDNPYVLSMAERGYPQTRIIISREGLPQARLVADNIQQTVSGLSFEVIDRETNEKHPFQTRLLGLHNVTNILCAAAAARFIGLSLAEIGMRVATLTPAEHRLNARTLPGGITVIDDSYSANPVGAISALEVLSLYNTGRRIVITPGMVELGHLQEEENYQLGLRLPDYATDIILVGVEQTRPIQRGVYETTFDPNRLLVMDTFEEARAWFQTQIRPGDTVLFLNDLPDTYL